MSFKNQNEQSVPRPALHQQLDPEVLDPALKATLASFRLSVHAWADAAASRPRLPQAISPHRNRLWRLAAGCALGCVLLAGGVSTGVYQHHRNQIRIAQALEAQHQSQLAAARANQQARDEEDLLAKVDSDIARQTPSAMEPLARLMSDDETR